jgi:hypothetical protein
MNSRKTVAGVLGHEESGVSAHLKGKHTANIMKLDITIFLKG